MKTFGAVCEVKTQDGKTVRFETCNLSEQKQAEVWLATEIKRQKAYLRRITDHFLTAQDN